MNKKPKWQDIHMQKVNPSWWQLGGYGPTYVYIICTYNHITIYESCICKLIAIYMCVHIYICEYVHIWIYHIYIYMCSYIHMHLQTLKCPASNDERLWERHASPVIQLPPSLVRFFFKQQCRWTVDSPRELAVAAYWYIYIIFMYIVYIHDYTYTVFIYNMYHMGSTQPINQNSDRTNRAC